MRHGDTEKSDKNDLLPPINTDDTDQKSGDRVIGKNQKLNGQNRTRQEMRFSDRALGELPEAVFVR
jgi:hypothetical protein